MDLSSLSLLSGLFLESWDLTGDLLRLLFRVDLGLAFLLFGLLDRLALLCLLLEEGLDFWSLLVDPVVPLVGPPLDLGLLLRDFERDLRVLLGASRVSFLLESESREGRPSLSLPLPLSLSESLRSLLSLDTSLPGGCVLGCVSL
uniref:Uncharacterized protein n=1 Tax=Arcella intermedia TaxID=1963864 RepID=A0A6B2LII8_9EUKA